MTAPTISSATLVGSTLAIVGSDFGTKTSAAPYKFFPLISNPNGDTAFDVGMDEYNADTSSSPMATVQVGTSELGKSLITTKTTSAANDGWTPAMGVFLPALTTSVLASFRLKITKTGGDLSTRPQWKTPRAGIFGSAPNSDGNNSYQQSTGTKFHAEHYAEGDGSMDSGAAFDLYLANSSGTGILNGASGDNKVTGWSQFNPGYNMFDTNGNDWRIYFDAGTIAGSDGQLYYWCNNQLVGWNNLQNIRLLASTANPLDQIMFLTGLQLLDASRTFTMEISRIYCDVNTQSRVELGNASTYAGCTRMISVPPTAWAAAAITSSDIQLTSVPAAYQWVYVTNSGGETNSSGFAYTGGSTFQPAWAINCNQVM